MPKSGWIGMGYTRCRSLPSGESFAAKPQNFEFVGHHPIPLGEFPLPTA
jgi:hypothetical protein